ncbi:ribosomal protein S18, variant [Phytophthora nicotianae P10297]|uniref:Ribosomal protein S18, variant n=3 Tax=Phytophthora nicotianae TaxID=4792 RepID=V9EUX0_PHYNI|nr:ribosomal protein S18, variant [Phytophthora nicotianae P1569]ETM42581.1 ribosomal protein S18, variant [Phytophthora nicotianae]ETP40526.1 ribosomal protein S18, variant [Phytophthora nicotianae P10297]
MFLSALGRVTPSAKTVVLRAQISRSLAARNDASPLIGGVRSLSTKSKDDGKKEFKKKSTFHKVEEDEDLTDLPEEVKYLSKQLDEKDLQFTEEIDIDDEDEDDEDAELSPAEWAEKFEREVAEWDQEEGEYDEDSVANASSTNVEDDRLYVEMPGYDASLSLAESQIGVNEDANVPDPFKKWDQGMAISPEMLNWMLPAEKRKPFRKEKTKPWKYFVAANHPDVVELALDVELLRLFISPTGRIRPRRFTGLRAKQQRKLAQAIKISRQMALLPYLSRYPEPTPEQWKAIDEEIIAAAELEDDDDIVDDDDDEDFDEDFEYE